MKPTHYAFLEDDVQIDKNDLDETLILDCITVGAAKKLHDRSWSNVAADDEALQETMLLSVKKRELAPYLGELGDGQWVSFVLNSADFPSKEESISATFVSLSGGQEDAALPEFKLSRVTATARRLPKLTCLVGLSVAKRQILDVLDDAARRAGNSRWVVVYDVGQGNASALVDEYGHPCLFYDLGWPTSLNQASRPNNRPDLFACDNCYWRDDFMPPVILSHWDYDHWAYAVANMNYNFGKKAANMTFHPKAVSRYWITPKPPRPALNGKGLGPTHLRLMSCLPNRLVWPNTMRRVSFCAGEITRTDPTVAVSNRNNQALAWFVMDKRTPSLATLLPGDINYQSLRWPKLVPGLVSLVATHHGGHAGIPPRPLVTASPRLAIAVGAPNVHRHPNPNTLTSHTSKGWPSPHLTSVRTSVPPHPGTNGSVLLPLTANAPKPAFNCPCLSTGNLVPTQ